MCACHHFASRNESRHKNMSTVTLMCVSINIHKLNSCVCLRVCVRVRMSNEKRQSSDEMKTEPFRLFIYVNRMEILAICKIRTEKENSIFMGTKNMIICLVPNFNTVMFQMKIRCVYSNDWKLAEKLLVCRKFCKLSALFLHSLSAKKAKWITFIRTSLFNSLILFRKKVPKTVIIRCGCYNTIAKKI